MTKFQKDLLERVVRTFVQAALALAATQMAGVTSLDSAKALVVAAVAACGSSGTFQYVTASCCLLGIGHE